MKYYVVYGLKYKLNRSPVRTVDDRNELAKQITGHIGQKGFGLHFSEQEVTGEGRVAPGILLLTKGRARCNDLSAPRWLA